MSYNKQIPFIYFKELKSFMNGYTKDEELIRNIIQSVFIWYYEKKDSISTKYPLAIILKKRCLFFLKDYYQEQAKKISAITMDKLIKEEQEYLYEGLVDNNTPLSKLIVKEKIDLITKLISDLSSSEQVLLIKVILGGIPYSKVSKELNISPGNARLKVNRIRKKIRRKMKD